MSLRPSHSSRHEFIVSTLLLAIVAAPRLARLAYPQVWIEDESYLTGALALAHGALPYRDFPLPHLPLLEAIAAAVFRIAGPSIRAAEAMTAIAAAGGTLLVFVIGRRLGGTGTALGAALVYSASPLLFRYHVFEREVFDVVPVLGAAAIALGPLPTRRPRFAAGVQGVLLAAALCIKLTALAAVAGLAAHAWTSGRKHAALVAPSIAVGLAGLFALALAAAFGPPFAAQVVLFRLLHATFPSLGVKLDELRLTLDFAFALGIGGVVLAWWSGRRRHWAIVLWQLAAGVVVLVLINPTYWAHTGIELLPWLSLAAGYLLAAVGGSVRRGRGAPRPTPSSGAAGFAAAVAAALLLFASPPRNLNWEAGDGSVFGFGYRDRQTIERAAAFVRAHSAPGDVVAVPALIAFQADRRELVAYPEIAGEVDDITAAIRREGYLAAWRDPSLGRGTFWESVEDSARTIAPRLADAVKRGEPAVVINDSSDDLMPVQLIDLSGEELRGGGYSLEKIEGPYELWARR